MEGVQVLDSATRLGPSARGAVAVCGSHGGLYPAWLAARAGLRGVVLNDAGIGRNSAGVAGVAWLDGLGIPACAIDYRSACIGDGTDMLDHGIVSTANAAASRHGCLPGHSCRQVLEYLARHAYERAGEEVPSIGEARARISSTGQRAVWALDSMALAQDSDARAVLVTGSHGALLGGRPDNMLAVDAYAAFFNDAGGGKDGAGYTRLAALDVRGMAAATVSCDSARIGDGRSTYETGVLSRVNEAARRLDLREGLTCREAVARLVGLA
jgi:hypothetical protein